MCVYLGMCMCVCLGEIVVVPTIWRKLIFQLVFYISLQSYDSHDISLTKSEIIIGRGQREIKARMLITKGTCSCSVLNLTVQAKTILILLLHRYTKVMWESTGEKIRNLSLQVLGLFILLRNGSRCRRPKPCLQSNVLTVPPRFLCIAMKLNVQYPRVRARYRKVPNWQKFNKVPPLWGLVEVSRSHCALWDV